MTRATLRETDFDASASAEVSAVAATAFPAASSEFRAAAFRMRAADMVHQRKPRGKWPLTIVYCRTGSSCRIAVRILDWAACGQMREWVPGFRSRMAQTMAVQFAVLSSGSRGNSTLICGKGAGLLIDVGIGPKILGERLESVGSSWSRIGSVVLTHTHADHVDTATFNELARRGVTVHCHEGHREALAGDAGFKKLEERRSRSLLRRSSVPCRQRAAAGADRAETRRRPDVRLPDRGVVRTARAAGGDRLPGGFRLLVGHHGRKPSPVST